MLCKDCKEDKALIMFETNRLVCRTCRGIKKLIVSRTKEGLANKIWAGQYQRSKRFDYELGYSARQLTKYLLGLTLYHTLYAAWEQANYDKWLIPSIDRIDNYKGYTFDNINLMTWRQNKDKFHSDRKNGISPKAVQPVAQVTKEGNILSVYHSSREAERKTGIDHSSILRVCEGKQHLAVGTNWKKISLSEFHTIRQL